MARLGDLFHGFKQVAACMRDRRHPRSIEATAVLQLSLCVEAEEIRRALCVIGAYHFLGGIDSVRKGEVMPCGERLHVVEGVFRIGLSVVWHYGDCADIDFT